MVVGENSFFLNLSTQLPSLNDGLSSWVVFGYSRAVPCSVRPLYDMVFIDPLSARGLSVGMHC